MDSLSQAVNSEVVAVIEARELAVQLRQRIAVDVADSFQYYRRQKADGTWEEHGPGEHFKGFKGILANLLGRWEWFKRVV